MSLFDPGRSLRDGLAGTDWADLDLWIASIALGGSFSLRDIAAITAGHRPPTHGQYDIIAAALNEHLAELGQDHPVRAWSQQPRPATTPRQT
jgi:hypothetical protein